MTDTGITVDDRDLIRALGRMSNKKMDKVYKKALQKSVEPIQKQARANLRKSGIKNVSKPYVSKRTGRTYGSMMKGVKTSVYVGEDSYAKVHIMGNFLLKWFEKGTSLRKTNKGWNRGSITGKWFFKSAVQSKSKECENSLEDNIRNSIIKTFDKK